MPVPEEPRPDSAAVLPASEQDAGDVAGDLAAINHSRAALGLEPLSKPLVAVGLGVFGRLSSEFLSQKAKMQSRSRTGEFVAERAHLDVPGGAPDVPEAPVARARIEPSALAQKVGRVQGIPDEMPESGRHLLETITNKFDAAQAGPDWSSEPIGHGVSAPHLWTNSQTGERYIVKDNGPAGTYLGPHAIQREAAAYTLMKILGLDNTPAAGQNGRVSVTEFAGARDRIKAGSMKEFDKTGGFLGRGRNSVVSKMEDPDDVLRIALADTVMANADRHGANVLMADKEDGAKSIYPIDHNMVLNEENEEEFFDAYDYAPFIASTWGRSVLPQYVAMLKKQYGDDAQQVLVEKLTQMQQAALAELAKVDEPGPLSRMRLNMTAVSIARLAEQIMKVR